MDFFDFQKKLRDDAQQERAAAQKRDVLTVSQLTAKIEAALSGAFPLTLQVQGEVSNFKAHSASGHLYFTLKDQGACIDCVMFRSDAARLRFEPEDGVELIAAGRVSVYPQRGRYQLYVTRLEPVGEGALQLAFKQLYARLDAEGLFSPERKKAIPAYPRRIALVTSTQTAAIQDMLKVLRRFSFLRLLAFHVPVQGEGAGGSIAAALDALSRGHERLGGIDVILLGRGGGSLEDLWPFNEEVVARAVGRCTIPVITGIGHEVDVSIADLVADHHAHTPTEAAQVATQYWRTAREELEADLLRLQREAGRILAESRQRLQSITRHALFARPADRIATARQFVDDRERALQLRVSEVIRRERARLQRLNVRLETHRPGAVLVRMRRELTLADQRLWRSASQHLQRCAGALLHLEAALRRHDPVHRVLLQRQRLESVGGRLARSLATSMKERRQRLEQLGARLQSLGPEQVLHRGYAIVSHRKGQIVRRATDVVPGEKVVIRLSEGQIEARTEDPKQPTLF